MLFSEKLKTVCTEAGISLKEISELTGISYSQIKDYNQGRFNPKIDKIQKIAAIPQLEPWRELLLDQTELTAEDAEIMTLIGRLRAKGREDDVIQILRDLDHGDAV